MKLALKIFILFTLFMALAIGNLSATPSKDESSFVDNDDDDDDKSQVEPTSVRGITSRFLAQKPRGGMTCNKYPRVCRVAGSPGPDCCKKRCVNVTTDRLNCGMCGKKCKYSEICCKGKCVNPMSNKKHCGGCNSNCNKGILKALSIPEAAAAKDSFQLTNVMMKLAISNAQATLNVINEMATKPGSPQALKALQSCTKVYKYAIQSFGLIFKELSEDPMSANYDVSVIGPEADTCEKALAIAKIQAPRISAGNRFLQYYSGMGNEVTNSVEIGDEE